MAQDEIRVAQAAKLSFIRKATGSTEGNIYAIWASILDQFQRITKE